MTEFYYTYRAYIFCLVNEYLFIYNEYTFQIFNYKINEYSLFNEGYYNLIPYKIENNITNFIITFNNEETKLFFYYYKFDINEDISEPKIILVMLIIKMKRN